MSIFDEKKVAAAAEGVTDNATQDITGRIIPALEGALQRQREAFIADIRALLDEYQVGPIGLVKK